MSQLADVTETTPSSGEAATTSDRLTEGGAREGEGEEEEKKERRETKCGEKERDWGQ